MQRDIKLAHYLPTSSLETARSAFRVTASDDDAMTSAAYRLKAAGNLLRRLYLRIAEPHRTLDIEAL